MNANSAPPLSASSEFAIHRSGSSRLVYLDALRGMLVVVMAINHIPSDLQTVTEHPFGFVSAAEGFVFLAGLMAGLVYTKKFQRGGPALLHESSVKRALTIYRYHLGAFFVVFAWVLAYGAFVGSPPPATPPQMAHSPWKTLVLAPLLLTQPSLFDILPMYCGLILLVPCLVRQFEAGKRTHVLLGSFGIWVLTNAYCPQIPLTTDWLQMGIFNVCAWQILFIFGAAFGHAWAHKEKILPQPNSFVIAVVFLAAAYLYAMRHAFIPAVFSPSELGWLTNKNNLAPLRLVDSALLFYLIHLAVTRFPQVASWRSLAFLGKSSLVVFAAHVVVASGIHSFPQVFADTTSGRWEGTGLMIAALYATAAFHQASPTWLARLTPLRTRKGAVPAANEPEASRAFGPADSVHR